MCQPAHDSAHDRDASTPRRGRYNTIRAWLGHVSVETTNIYAEIDLASKTKALATCTVQPDDGDPPIWKDNKDLLVFLRSL